MKRLPEIETETHQGQEYGRDHGVLRGDSKQIDIRASTRQIPCTDIVGEIHQC